MKIAIGNDHAAFEMKNIIKEYLEAQGHEMIDVGAYDEGRVDYPVYAEKIGKAVTSGEAELGIAICGTGVGMSIAVNKVRGVRAVCCSEPYSAKLSRMHNDSNVLCFGARVIGPELAKMIVDEWIGAAFMGEHHVARVDMIRDLESRF